MHLSVFPSEIPKRAHVLHFWQVCQSSIISTYQYIDVEIVADTFLFSRTLPGLTFLE